jgi:glycine cleavage system H protein
MRTEATRPEEEEEAMSEIPDDLRYSEDHIWIRPDSEQSLTTVGVTDYAQDSLGDVVNITLPAVGQSLTRGEAFGEIESTKNINDLVSPLDGTVQIRNDALADAPELVNTDPYRQGWMLQVQVASSTLTRQLGALMDASAYRSRVNE